MEMRRELLEHYHEASWALATGRAAKEKLPGDWRTDSTMPPTPPCPNQTRTGVKLLFKEHFVQPDPGGETGTLSGAHRCRSVCRDVHSRMGPLSTIPGISDSDLFLSGEISLSIPVQNPAEEDIQKRQEKMDRVYHEIRFERLSEGYGYTVGKEESNHQQIGFQDSQNTGIYIQATNSDTSSVCNFDRQSSNVW